MFVCTTCGQRYPESGYCAVDGAPLVVVDDPLLGTEIDRYRIARTLGEGGMGKVYLAVQPAIGSRVAIKLLSDQCAKTPELVERFFAEARAVNLVKHEHIVSVLDMAQLPDGRPFIVMEFVEGQTLAEIVHTTVAPLGGIVQVMGEVLAALGAAHAIGIVHRDLKPDNILVTAEGHAKVLDFGIAKLAPNLRDVGSATRTGALLGTPAYMAPEQISGAANVDGRTDVYAAGCVLFEAVTGHPPFQGGSMFDLMRAHVEQAPPPPRALRPDLPPALEQIILTALAKDPAQRFQSATAMAQALAHASTELGPEHWRALSSTRNAVLTPRISGGGLGAQPTPRGTPPQQAHDAPAPRAEQYRSHATTPAGAERRRTGWLVAIGTLIVVGVIALVAGLRGGGDDHPVVAAVGSSGSAQLLTTPTPPESPATGLQSPATGPQSPATGPQSPATGPSQQDPANDVATPPPSSPPRRPPTRTSPTASGVSTGDATTARAGSPDGPMVAGGDSAADHNVVIGPNVHIGAGVVIGGSLPPTLPTRKSLVKPVDYDSKHFDPVAYIGRAEAIAQELLSDAKLTELEFDPVWPDGHVDLTVDGRSREYNFRSASASARPADMPKNVAVDRACMVHVEVSPSGVTAQIQTSDRCDAPLVRRPTCHFVGVWKQALAAGTGRDVVARIAWLKDEKWFFDTELGAGNGGVSSFPDACH